MMDINSYVPKVSIIIPAYNAANYLTQAINSALNQTYPNIEIIVVNDGSRDDGATTRVVMEYRNKIRSYEKENGGTSSALNCGIRRMEGEWFSWLSHDDLYEPMKIEKQIEYIRKLALTGADIEKQIFFTASMLINKEGRCLRKSSSGKEAKFAERIERIMNNKYLIAEPTQYTFHGCGCLIHRNAFHAIGYFNENLRMLQDVDLWFRLYSNNYRLHYIPDALVKGRIHKEQDSRKIGFSYHNAEQDWYWERSLQWLKDHYENDYEVLILFLKDAYRKTRYTDGDKAFDIVVQALPSMERRLRLTKNLLKLKAEMRTALKKVYFKLQA